MKSKVLSILLAIEIIKIVGVVTYDIKCPHRSHWQLRAIQYKCQNEPFYHCLYDKNTKNLTEKCTKPDDIPSGFRAVLSGNLDVEKCSDTYFAPFMYWSNDSVECPYQKSVCAEEGQVILDNGSEEEDVKCFCDYRQGYEYIFKPKHDCYCSPTDEDCTCFRKKCKDEGSILTSVTIWFIRIKRKRGIDENEILWKNVKKLSKFPDLRQKLNKNCILVLKGRPGTGKNAIANGLKRFNRSNTCKIITNDDLSEIKSSNNKKTKFIIKAEYISSELESLLKPLKPTDIMCDLDDDNFYDANDKKNILTFHRKRNNILSEDEWKQCQTKQTTTEVYMKKSLEADLCREKTLKGFPWMCASLCKDHINLGIRYFRQPPADLVSELDDLKIKGEHDNSSAIKYCLLVSVLLSNDDELTVDNILKKSFGKAMTDIYPKKVRLLPWNVLKLFYLTQCKII
ncbi:unnamed protein product [Mytilus edulis]|uniref:ATPase AAA-type core domain-containing protein n=1 Tax=Mytilus edulis TaxID=6550 RepID=A0A8S3SIR7_MYTED|nr:unnamed protein product [Mytilus edulis]